MKATRQWLAQEALVTRSAGDCSVADAMPCREVLVVPPETSRPIGTGGVCW